MAEPFSCKWQALNKRRLHRLTVQANPIRFFQEVDQGKQVGLWIGFHELLDHLFRASDGIEPLVDDRDDVKVETKKDLVIVTAKFGGAEQTASFELEQVHSVLFRGREGNDKFENKSSVQSVAYGNQGHDHLKGGNAADRLYGGPGNDKLEGRGGDDSLHGDYGNDRIFGGDGDDLLYGWLGDDFLQGDSGVDRLSGWLGEDVMKLDKHDSCLDADQRLDPKK